MVQSWANNDGLYLKYGPDKATANPNGEYRNNGTMREIKLKIDLTALTESETPVSDTVFFPSGVRVQEVEVVTTTAAATGTAIDLGLVSTNRTTPVEVDYNGFLAAFPTSHMDLAGERYIFTAATTVPASGTGTGALIGTTTSSVAYISCSRTTATAFTAGVIEVTIRYYVP